MTLDNFPKREYGPTDMEPMYDVRPYSFELNEDWLAIMAKEFDMAEAAADFARTVAGSGDIEAAGEVFFRKYGADLMKRNLQLGEEYMDRTYEVLKIASDKTDGYLAWPLVPQRFIEAAMMSIQDTLVIPVIQNSYDCLQFRIEECRLYWALREKCGDAVAGQLPCRYGCLAMVETAFTSFDLGAMTTMTATAPRQGYCEFTTTRI
jgi:hypothetical protein